MTNQVNLKKNKTIDDLSIKDLSKINQALGILQALAFMWFLKIISTVYLICFLISIEGVTSDVLIITIVGVLTSGLAALGIYSYFKRPTWGLNYILVIMFLGLFAFPVGTILGLFGFIAKRRIAPYWQDERLKNKALTALIQMKLNNESETNESK